MRLRRYCWYCGWVFDLKNGEQCPECYQTDHRPVVHQGLCCAFAPSSNNSPMKKGGPCGLDIGHSGPHRIMTEGQLKGLPLHSDGRLLENLESLESISRGLGLLGHAEAAMLGSLKPGQG